MLLFLVSMLLITISRTPSLQVEFESVEDVALDWNSPAEFEPNFFSSFQLQQQKSLAVAPAALAVLQSAVALILVPFLDRKDRSLH